MNKQLAENFIQEIKDLILQARKKAYTSVNLLMVEAYWNIGRRIVEEEQKGKNKAEYGEELLKQLSLELAKEFGKGFSEVSLRNYRQFYIVFSNSSIRSTLWSESKETIKNNKYQVVKPKTEKQNLDLLRPELTWSHYKLIMRVKTQEARNFYIKESANEGWSVRNLERNINSFYYERILSSQHKTIDQIPTKAEANDETRITTPDGEKLDKPSIRDFIKDPFVLEFLDLPTNLGYQERDLEKALISHLQSFLLELGKGFAFVARQQHIRTEHSDFFIDLVFYNYKLKCFVLIDLKTGKLTHQDIGQIDMYVRIYDELKRGESDSPTIGIVLCTETDSVVAKYSVLKGNEQLFASKYSTILPSEDELKREIEREIKVIEAKLNE